MKFTKLLLPLLIIGLIGLVFISGCSDKNANNENIPVDNTIENNINNETKENNENTNMDIELEENKIPIPKNISQMCDLNGIDYYTNGVFIYHVDTKDFKLVYSPVGTYTKESENDRWSLRLYDKSGINIYTRTIEYIENRKFPNDDPITCEEVSEVPKIFQDFIDSHWFFFDKSDKAKELQKENMEAIAESGGITQSS